jgi:prophage antirepressor-like protein
MEIINYNGKVLNILGSVDQPYFLGAEVGRILGYNQPTKAIWDHVWKHNKILYSELFGTIPFQNGSHIKPHSILLSEHGLYQLIFASKLETAQRFQQFIIDALPKIRKQQLIDTAPKLIKNQFVIKNEMDLHQKVVAYIRKYYPDALINASLGENQDTSEKRIVSYKAGYTKGSPDLHIAEPNHKYIGLYLEFKTPNGKGIVSPSQKQILDRLISRGNKCIISDDYDDVIKQINDYLFTRRIKCEFCNRKFKTEITLKNHQFYFHRMKLN